MNGLSEILHLNMSPDLDDALGGHDASTALVGAQHMELTAVLTPAEEGGFVAFNPETGTTTQGETVEEAVANLREATALYLSEFPLPTTGHPVVTLFTVSEPARA